jgi:hypothetical protein
MAPAFLTSALDGVEWSASRSGLHTHLSGLHTRCTVGWLGPKSGLDVVYSALNQMFSTWGTRKYLT